MCPCVSAADEGCHSTSTDQTGQFVSTLDGPHELFTSSRTYKSALVSLARPPAPSHAWSVSLSLQSLHADAHNPQTTISDHYADPQGVPAVVHSVRLSCLSLIYHL